MSNISNNSTVRATILKINNMFQIRRYFLDGMTKAIGEPYTSEIEAQHAFYREFPNSGKLAEEVRKGIIWLPNREMARHIKSQRSGWSVKDNGKDAGLARWACVKI